MIKCLLRAYLYVLVRYIHRRKVQKSHALSESIDVRIRDISLHFSS